LFGKYVYAVFTGILILVGEQIDPSKTWEKLFIVAAMILGQALTAIIFGSMASIVRNYSRGNSLFVQKLDSINEDFRRHGISRGIRWDIHQFYDYVW
jgi:hypothetical protein